MLNKPRWVVLAWVLATLTIASGMLQLTSLNKYEGDLPTTDPLVADRARFEAAFGDGQTMLVAVESTDLMSSRSIQRLREISAGLSRIPGVPEDGVIGLATLTSGPAAGRLIDVIEALSTEDLRASAIASRPELARFVSSDGNTTLIAVTVSRRASQSAVASAVASVVMTFSGPERIYVIGDHSVAQAIDKGIEADLSLLLPVACLLIFVAMRICFGSTRDAILTLGVMVGSIVWVLGFLG